MPRLVVPICVPAADAASRCASSSRCSLRISVTFSAIASVFGETSTPCAFELGDLLDEVMRVDDDAVADDGQPCPAARCRTAAARA